ncbi:hypothetical protein KOXY103107_07060 [Komagataeibacter xylinus]
MPGGMHLVATGIIEEYLGCFFDKKRNAHYT